MKTLNRLIVTVFIATLAFSMLACSVLLAPKGGRWNPADPKAELIVVEIVVDQDDGYLETVPPAYYPFYDPGAGTLSIKVSDWELGLFRFNLDELPEVVVSAELRLHQNYDGMPTPASDTIDVHRILQPWSSSTNWASINLTSFYDQEIGASIVVSQVIEFFHWNVTEMVLEMLSTNENHGFLLGPVSAPNFYRFDAFESNAELPTLIIKGYNP
jgi:hypothetical protein